MKKVFVDEMIVWVVQAKLALEDADIPCFIKNEFSGNLAGEVPFTETWPELWIHRDDDHAQAKTLLQPLRDNRTAHEQTTSTLSDWTCSQCGERNEGNFSLCWSCGVVLTVAD
ncbi:hypothetical protein MNBD_GAMMA02-1216 [hydrothermal vent metagenome]|uniref:RanBP2-type domain-containing protein n=1 Tax=hydrothermal vent metagenome TaxID=652676 RepID=A0A3B0W3C9_9ZZZZ